MDDASPKPSRRGFFVGAIATGAATAAMVSLRTTPDPVVIKDALQPPPEKGGGYVLSEHVKRSYKTTRV